jgi:hypothetical protein
MSTQTTQDVHNVKLVIYIEQNKTKQNMVFCYDFQDS